MRTYSLRSPFLALKFSSKIKNRDIRDIENQSYSSVIQCLRLPAELTTVLPHIHKINDLIASP